MAEYIDRNLIEWYGCDFEDGSCEHRECSDCSQAECSHTQVMQIPTVQAIPLDKVKRAREQIIDEKDFAYADFEQYKEEVLHAESDELPDDDFRYGMERCLEILDKLIEESEGKEDGNNC